MEILNEKVLICQFDRIFSLGNNTSYENFTNNNDINIINNNKEEFILEKIHDKRRIILQWLFEESLIRAAL